MSPLLLVLILASPVEPGPQQPGAVPTDRSAPPRRTPERPGDLWRPREETNTAGALERCGPWTRGPFVSVQVNVDGKGCNIVGDAANEPSIAIDPTDPQRIAIGWRQFDSISSDFRQAGYAYSSDAGESWTFPGVLRPGVFASDPVLASDADGDFYFYSLQPDRGPGSWACYLYKSFDGGMTWPHEVYAYGGDKAWFTIDTTDGPGKGNVYMAWDLTGCCGDRLFTRSIDSGATFSTPQPLMGNPAYGTIAVGPAGEVYVSGVTAQILRSLDAQLPNVSPRFDVLGDVDLEGEFSGGGPNPAGLLGQSWIAVDRSVGAYRGFVYTLCSVWPFEGFDPLDVMFARSSAGGARWSPALRVNDDPTDNGAYQWFGTLSVAPNGRLDAVWNDTRMGLGMRFSALFYSSSVDAGRTWSPNVRVSRVFNSYLGWPQQAKLGDYYHAISDREGVNVAYAATFNGEQDVYFLRIPADCNGNRLADATEIALGREQDENSNGIPDACEPDTDGDSVLDYDDVDLDGDGVGNIEDRCMLGPVEFRTRPNGSPFGDQNEDCRIDLYDHNQWATVFTCFSISGPGVNSVGRRCRDGLDFDADEDIDLADVAAYQRIFGQYGG